MKARSFVVVLWMLERGVVERLGSAGELICGAMDEMDIGFGAVIGAGEPARGVIEERPGWVVPSMGSSTRLSTVTSAKVVVGGSFRRTVRNVSWK